MTDLGVSKALVLLALPASERDEFLEKKHTVNGEEKGVMNGTNWRRKRKPRAQCPRLDKVAMTAYNEHRKGRCGKRLALVQS